MTRRQNAASVQAAIDGHPCTIDGRDAHLIGWGRPHGHGHGRTARITWVTTGTNLRIDKTAITPTPCKGGCGWCQP